jgi:hypothetical protein
MEKKKLREILALINFSYEFFLAVIATILTEKIIIEIFNRFVENHKIDGRAIVGKNRSARY